MPIYEYVCDECGHELEALQGMNDPELTDCPECEAASLRRRISAVAFRLKGSGWYETDFKSDKRRNLADDGKAEAPAKDGKDKQEAKPGKEAKPSGEGKAGKAKSEGKDKGKGKDKAAPAKAASG